jgi:hypothetical protein
VELVIDERSGFPGEIDTRSLEVFIELVTVRCWFDVEIEDCAVVIINRISSHFCAENGN